MKSRPAAGQRNARPSCELDAGRKVIETMKNLAFNPRNSNVLQFPRRGPCKIEILRECDGTWLVLAREHGWLHGSRDAALADAELIAAGHGVAITNHTTP
jgi:hypothetical protein